MPSFTYLALCSAALSSFAAAGPVPVSNTRSTLSPRIVSEYAGCSDSQKTKLGNALNDVNTLAIEAYDNMDNNAAQWGHYFRTSGAGKDEDWTHARGMWSAIMSNNDPTNAPYRFSIRCAATDDAECANSPGTLAITDTQPEKDDAARQMKICPSFFDANEARTKNDLASKEFKKNPGRRDNSWCQPGQKFVYYEIAGLTILHEMTHLDGLAKSAGYPEVEDSSDPNNVFKSHGTDDVTGLDGTPHIAARQLAKLWQDGKQADGALTPFRNAESIAAATLEWYMMTKCDISEISQ